MDIPSGDPRMATANNRSVARRVTTLAIALVALVLVLVGLAIRC